MHDASGDMHLKICTLCLQAGLTHTPALPMCSNLTHLPNVETCTFCAQAFLSLDFIYYNGCFCENVDILGLRRATISAACCYFTPACALLPIVFRQ